MWGTGRQEHRRRGRQEDIRQEDRKGEDKMTGKQEDLRTGRLNTGSSRAVK